MDIKNAIIKKSNSVSKHNSLVYKPYKLDTNELKLLSGIISLVNSMPNGGDQHFHTYRLKIHDIHRLLGFKSKGSLNDIKKAFKGLMAVESQSSSENNIEEGIIEGWIENTKYVYKDGYGYFDVKLNDKLGEYLLGLSNTFTEYKLHNILNLQNPYSIRIYEILKSASGLGGKKEITLLEIRNILKLGDKYPLFANFKIKVLDVVQKEINENTDIFIDYEVVKDGKKVVGLLFQVKENSKQINVLEPISSEFKPSIENKLLGIGITGKTLDELLMQYEEEKLEKCYKMLEDEMKIKGKNIKSPSGWYLSCLRENYTLNKNSHSVITDFYKAQSIEEEKDRVLEKRKLDDYKKQFNEWFNNLSNERKNELLEQYKKGSSLQDKDLLIKARISIDYAAGIIF